MDVFRRLFTALTRTPTAPLLLILLVGVGLRLPLLPTPGFILDLEQHQSWSAYAIEHGLLKMYSSRMITHPPLSVSALVGSVWAAERLGADLALPLEDNPPVTVALKLPSLLFEIATALLAYYVARRQAGKGWALFAAAALYLNPGLLVNNAWWGQTDSIYAFFLVAAVYFLQRRWPRWAWAMYALAWLAKFQSIMFGPLLVALTWRRHGWRALAAGLAIFAGVFGAGMLPFLLGSGEDALYPFTGTMGLFPYISNGAYNLWYLISGSPEIVKLDTAAFVGGLTYFQVGMIAMAAGTALLCLRAALPARRDDLYLLAAAAGVLFFSLPTQIQVRYLYPAVVFLALAAVKRWALVAVFAGVTVTFAYNMLDAVWRGHGLLHYPFQLMFWSRTADALAFTVLATILAMIAFGPLWEAGGRLLRRTAQGEHP
jgi:hypothetical protein